MPSTFTWLDYSDHDRRKMLDAIHLLDEKDTRDELGIGAIRDAFADIFFPGTSTIQRRAKYFLFVPWTYLNLERRKVSSSQFAIQARRQETMLIDTLADSEDTEGIIGIEARASLKRLPSDVYWQGLSAWGIRLFPSSRDRYHRSIDTFYDSAHRHVRTDDGDAAEGAIPRNWHSAIPVVPDDFPKSASFRLNRYEADYLRERILFRAPRTLLAFLIDGTPSGTVGLPWEHSRYGELPSHLKEQVDHARNFSEVIHGAPLLYNLMLAEKSQHKDMVEIYQEALEKWAAKIEGRGVEFVHWDRSIFWKIVESEGARITPRTRQFINSWLDIVFFGNELQRICEDNHARLLVHEREQALKGKLARLSNQRALELWSGAAGTAQLNYRWGIVQKIVDDILQGLQGIDNA